jgi:hypothetical protein
MTEPSSSDNDQVGEGLTDQRYHDTSGDGDGRGDYDSNNSTDSTTDSSGQNRFTVHTLVETNQRQQEQILQLQMELNQLKVQHKEGIYWLQLQLDTTRREKDTVEERMAELQEDLKDLASSSPVLPPPAAASSSSSNEVSSDEDRFRVQKRKYELSLGTLENQINMIKTSYGEINRSLKEEICDLMEDRTNVELDLLNQLAELDDAKRKKELELSTQLTRKQEEIKRLEERAIVAEKAKPKESRFQSDRTQELEEELRRMHALKAQLDDVIERERHEADEIINDLKDQKMDLELRLGKSENDLAKLRSECDDTTNAKQLLEQLRHDREDINSKLARVAGMKQTADTTIQSLEEIMDKFQIDDDDDDGNTDRMLSVIESASLLHGQIKVSLMLIEMQLRNHVERIKHDEAKKRSSETTPIGGDVSKKLEDINHDALSALKQVETALLQQIDVLKEGILKENKDMAESLEDHESKLTELQHHNAELEAELMMLRKSGHHTDRSPSREPTLTTKSALSESVLDQLQSEVVRVVQRIQEKNEIIANLKEELATHIKREDTLRKELKRAIRAKVIAEGSTNQEGGWISKKNQRQLSTQQQRFRSSSEDMNIHSRYVSRGPAPRYVEDFSSPSPTTPIQLMAPKQLRRNSTGQAFEEATSPIVQTPPSGTIKPLRPSPRELFTSKTPSQYSSLFVKSLAFSPTKSPTGVEAGP